MSIVGSLHIQCGFVGKCGGHVFPVDADRYLSDLADVAMNSVKEGHAGTYSYPNRYCPACEAIDKHRSVETAQQRDERIEARRSAQEAEMKEESA